MTTDTGAQPQPKTSAPGVLSRDFRLVTIGACALIFLGAFESLAVTTVMPTVSADLGGERLFALALAAPLATGVIGMVVSGNWSDRHGPVGPLYAAVIVFVLGLLVAGLAPTMEVLVAGRFLQGLGSGAQMVALYVVVARVYPERLRPAIFAGFAAAWVIPSLVGPAAAGIVTELVSWHWVFLGVVGLVLIALLMVVPVLRTLAAQPSETRVPWAYGRMGWAALAAFSVLALDLVADVPAIGWALALAALVLALVTVKRLLPRGALRAVRGLPSVVLVRGVAAAAFFGAEVYLPYLLTDRYAFSPAIAGLALTGGALAWSIGSGVQGKLGERLAHGTAVRVGSALVLAGITVLVVTSLLGWHPLMTVLAWAVAGSGMGVMCPRLSVLTLSMSTSENQGFNSSAMAIADIYGSALAIAIAGVVFGALAGASSAFTGVFAFAGVIAVLAVLLAPRVTDAATRAV